MIVLEPDTSSAPADEVCGLTVAARTELADRVVMLELQDECGSELPSWTPGAHIDLLLEPGLVRQYSLCGDPADRGRWRIAVLHEPHGRGGSSYVHERLTVGARVSTRGPRNNFRLEQSARYLFVAGGIGITPILPMIRQVHAQECDWSLLYGGRTMRSMAFVQQLKEFGDRVVIRPQDDFGLLDLDHLFDQRTADTLVYCCGPEPLLDAVTRKCAHWEPGRLHLERFTPRTDPLATDAAFTVELGRSNLTFEVPQRKSILDVLTEAGVDVLTSCENGVCGTCLVSVVSGTPDHRDSVLSSAERDAGSSMALCVSRALTPTLVLDL